MNELGSSDMFRVFIPEEYEGLGGGCLELCLVVEELSRVCSAVAVSYAASALGCMTLMEYGTDEQKRKYLPDIASGKKLGAFAITEPTAGSDAGNIKTTAEKAEGGYLLNGTKQFITNGGEAEIYTVMALTDKTKGARGASAIIVEKDTPGFTFGKKEKKMGIRSSATRELVFKNCLVPEESLLGERGKGFNHIMWELQNERIFSAVAATARAQVAFEMALEYATQRVQFGRPIANLQVTRHKLVDMATQLEAARQLAYHVAWLYENGEYPVKEISMAKLFATEIAFKVADEAMQIHGGYGYMMDFPIQQYWRDIRVSRFMAGTSEIQKEIIAGILVPKVKKE